MICCSAPSIPSVVEILPTSSNILSARIENVDDKEGYVHYHVLGILERWSFSCSLTCSVHSLTFPREIRPFLLATTADRRLHVVDFRANALEASHSDMHDSPVLSCAAFGKFLLSSSMSGQLHLSDYAGAVLQKRRDHSKYVVRVAIHDDPSVPVIATAGWDNKILIYRPKTTSSTDVELGEPIAQIPLSTKPEAIIFVKHPENNEPILLVGRTDSTLLSYYTIEDTPRLLGTQNLAPHSNAWVAFSPSTMELCPTDPTLVAVGTSSVPHMKLLIVRLLFPPLESVTAPAPPTAILSAPASMLDPDDPARETQASQARAALIIANREDAAIQIHSTTMAPQTIYSTPAVAWRPDGSGVWVNGDDGNVRGIEVKTGKVAVTLRGHEAGSKVRCLWAGIVDDREVLVSGGFDHRLIVWNIDDDSKQG